MVSTPLSHLFRLFILLCSVATLFSCHPPQKPTPLFDKKELLNIVKARTMVLIIPDKELPYLEDYKQMLPQAWTISPIKVVTCKEAALYPAASEQYTYFNLTLWTKETRGRFTNYIYIGLDIPFRVSGRDKNRVKFTTFGQIDMEYNRDRTVTTKGKPLIEQLYTDYVIPNFTLPYMMAYLRLTQEKLQGVKTSREEYLKDEALVAQLRKGTLYVTDSTFFNVSGKLQKEKNPFASYPGKYEYISTDSLINILKEGKKEPVFLFDYATGGFKYIRVWELRSLRTAYRKLIYGNPALNSQDLRKIFE